MDLISYFWIMLFSVEYLFSGIFRLLFIFDGQSIVDILFCLILSFFVEFVSLFWWLLWKYLWIYWSIFLWWSLYFVDTGSGGGSVTASCNTFTCSFGSVILSLFLYFRGDIIGIYLVWSVIFVFSLKFSFIVLVILDEFVNSFSIFCFCFLDCLKLFFFRILSLLFF